MNFKSECINYFNRMKYYVLLSSLIFIAFLLLAYIYPSFFNSILGNFMQNMKEGINKGDILLETIPLFINNFGVALRIYTNGIYLSIPSLYLLAYNAAAIGYSGAMMPINYYLAYTVPHGVIELSAIIFSAAASFRLTHGLLKILSGITFNKNKGAIFFNNLQIALKMILDSGILMFIVLIMLIIAAFIEANLTLPIAKALLGV